MPPETPGTVPAETSVAARLAAVGAQVFVRGWLSANNIAFFGADAEAPTLVDTGYATHADQTLGLVDRALAGRPLLRVVNTHLHSDHCGGNAPLAARWPGLRIDVPQGYQDRLEPWDDDRLSYRDTDQRCERFRPTGYLRPGTTITLGSREWEVHATPGHDPDAIVLFEPVHRVLISGDALWERRLAIIFPELSDEGGFSQASQALDLIERLRPALVLPGHGEPFEDVAAALRASRERLDGFVRAPEKHRQHAARALLTYHMLEHQRRSRSELIAWMAATPIFQRALRCTHDSTLAAKMAEDVVNRLCADRVLVNVGGALTLASDNRAN